MKAEAMGVAMGVGIPLENCKTKSYGIAIGYNVAVTDCMSVAISPVQMPAGAYSLEGLLMRTGVVGPPSKDEMLASSRRQQQELVLEVLRLKQQLDAAQGRIKIEATMQGIIASKYALRIEKVTRPDLIPGGKPGSFVTMAGRGEIAPPAIQDPTGDDIAPDVDSSVYWNRK